MDDMNLTAVFVEGEFGFTAYIDEMRGVITQGKSIEEAEENLLDALQMYLEPDDDNVLNVGGSNVSVIKKSFISLQKYA